MAMEDELLDLAAMAAEELDPDLAPWVEEEGVLGMPMLRHPLVYQVPLYNAGLANRALDYKKKLLADYITVEDWHGVVFLHERPYRLKALIEHCTGWEHDEDGPLWPLHECPEHWALAADVWVDSENIGQNIEEWRALIGDAPSNGLWLGNEDERAEFDALPDPIRAWRGGLGSAWSWTTDWKVAHFFAQRMGRDYPIHQADIPKADCFGYLTRRNEDELLVRIKPGRG